ncbi:sugar phosphate isomerase/epimerase family protein [Actinomadura sp. HBU206391]|uniref:sugar phosphate isomerase/epimerase family protein n=1 Tax=Actinomadura sp. HBU206391 TaxID=2731692 RepID=UPI0016501D21|nr:sugar phosphate isomerase/epimerase [Actinomadura sp. HBU206391]MBC6458332.1 sugar phosphate isomerase/epimerase [Actinomadura sp. HBU206391]
MNDLNRRTLMRGAALTAMGLGAGAALTGTASATGTGRGHGHGHDHGRGHGHGHGYGRVPRSAISIQLYSLRDLLAVDLEGTLEKLAEIGYEKVELAGLHGRTAKQFRAILNRHGLRATSGHVGVSDNWQASLDDARTLGHRYIVHPYANFATADEWRAFADQLEPAGEAARKAGLQFGYHNHAHEFARLPTGEVPFDFITATDRRLVHLEVDLYWAMTGGVDPVSLFHAHRGRIKQFHVKDRAADGSFTDLGTGTIDFPRIFSHGHEAGVVEYIVERDTQPDPLKTARVGYDYLRRVRFRRR